MNKPKILLLNSLYIYGGGEYFTFIIARYLQNSGYEVVVSCPEKSLLNNKCADEGINVLNLDYPRSGKGNLTKIVGELKKYIKDNQIQIVHSNTNFDRTAGAFAAMKTKAVHVASVHSFYSIKRNLTHLIRNKYYIKHFIASGERIKSLLIEKDNIQPENITAINLGIDSEEFKRNFNIRKQQRSDLNISDDDIVIGNVGRLVQFKGQENLIRAFDIINRKYSNTRLIIVGGGELENKLKELCKQLDVKDKVIFTGFIENLSGIYSVFDIYSHTSYKGSEELFPFAILYALAQGVPIVATNTGEIYQMVSENHNGYLLESNEPNVIAEKIENLISDKEKIKSFGTAGIKLLQEKFTIEKMGKTILEIYEKSL